MNLIFRFFTHSVLSNIHIPQSLKRELLFVIEKCRKSGRLFKDNKIKRSDLFNHSHFNALFLKLNPYTIQLIKENSKYRNVHRQIYNLSFGSSTSDINVKKEK